MHAVCVQPPFVQLNSPYPAVWYLDAWLRSRGVDAIAVDHSIALARRLFGREGLAAVFSAARKALAGRKHPDAETARRVRAYLGAEPEYLAISDSLLAFLSGGDPAFAYRLAVGAGIPLGMRAEAVMGEGIGPDDARALATAILDDLSDFIRYALDPGFGTVRYAERLASSASSLAPAMDASKNGWTMREAYRPMLREEFDTGTLAQARLAAEAGDRVLFLLSIPFPGCLAGALAAASEARSALGDRAVIVAGGGYVSTELRFVADTSLADASLADTALADTALAPDAEPSIFDAFDYLAYDSGYGALASILDALGGTRGLSPGAGPGLGSAVGEPAAPDTAADGPSAVPLYRVARRDPATGRVEALGFPADEPCRRGGSGSGAAQGASRDPAAKPAPTGDPRLSRYAELEAEALPRIHPDYLGLDPDAYLRVVAEPNPARRLWNDTPWLKYRLAYGCYWARCAFCDTELDYIKRYVPSDLEALMAAAGRAAERTGLFGIHFVDEAMPVNLVRAFAKANAERRRPFTFWGNVRFDKAWNDESCAYAADRGLVAVSGGVEIATGKGLSIVDKGFTLDGLGKTLASFKRSGVLVHSYLIYGFPGQSDQDIADSAEVARVLVEEGLVDSAFWHKFVLTRHSRMYAEWEGGKRPGLAPIAPRTAFALNDLRFDGEARYDRWTDPLDAALSAWVDDGEPGRPLSEFLPKGLPRPRIDARAELGITRAVPGPRPR